MAQRAATFPALTVLLVAVCTLPFPGAWALDNGLGRVPQMGYNGWYDVQCTESMNETTLMAIADKLVDLGFVNLGYAYFNLDDCWAAGRRGDGTPYADEAKFTNGELRTLSDYVHARGMLFGTYTDRGEQTCAGRPGSSGYETIDAQTYAAWGVDYLKEDSCNAPTDHEAAFAQYAAMRDALNATGRPIWFSLCGWAPWYAARGRALGNSWRTGPDNGGWGNILTNIDNIAELTQYAGPGGWNDPCLLISVKAGGERMITELQTRAQFSMWAVLAAPLLISGSVLDMSDETLRTYSNRGVIGISQDPLGRPGNRVLGGAMAGDLTPNVWARPLSGNRTALLFFNPGPEVRTVTCGPACFAAAGWPAGPTQPQLLAYDVWGGNGYPMANRSLGAVGMLANGGHSLFIISVLQ